MVCFNGAISLVCFFVHELYDWVWEEPASVNVSCSRIVSIILSIQRFHYYVLEKFFCLTQNKPRVYSTTLNTSIFFHFRVDITSENRLKKFRDGGDDTISGDALKKKLETQWVYQNVVSDRFNQRRILTGFVCLDSRKSMVSQHGQVKHWGALNNQVCHLNRIPCRFACDQLSKLPKITFQ